MRRINEQNRQVSTVLSFTLIPLSGLATDVYLPSFPDMAAAFNTSSASIQQTMVLFLVSYGISQFFVGSILDSFGRYRLNLVALFVFTVSNFVIIITRDINIVHLMRVIQGICTAFIVVGKRAFFVDVYTGKKQKHYTGMLTIIWATAPIVAPFLGGFLQKAFGWTSGFYLLGLYGLAMLLLEGIFSGESLRTPQPFHPAAMLKVYRKLFSTVDFSAGVLVLGASYTMVMVFSMAAPFVIEHNFHLSPVVTGYCALLSGAALFFGGILGKTLKGGSLYRKLLTANLMQVAIIVLMFAGASLYTSLPLLMLFVVLVHGVVGYVYNLFFTYCLTRFPEHAGVAGGVTSGGSYLITSISSSGILGLLTITGQRSLAVGYLVCTLLIMGVLILAGNRLRKAAGGSLAAGSAVPNAA